MTSLAFMLTEVPAPPWKTSIGNWSRQRPSVKIRSQALTMALVFFPASLPRSWLARAAAFLTWAKARISPGWSLIFWSDIRKFSTARKVWMPQ